MAVISYQRGLDGAPEVFVERHRGPDRVLRGVLLGADLSAIVVAMVAAYWLRAMVPISGETTRVVMVNQLIVGAASIPLWVYLLVRYRLYRHRMTQAPLEEFIRIAHVMLVGCVLMGTLGFALHISVARGWVAWTAPLGLGLLWADRTLARVVVGRRRRAGGLLRSVLIVGTGPEALTLAEGLLEDGSVGYDVIGFVGPEPGGGDSHYLVGPRRQLVPVLGSIDTTAALARRLGVSGVVVAPNAADPVAVNRLVRDLLDDGLHVEMASSLRDIHYRRLLTTTVAGWVFTEVDPIRRHGWRMLTKRTLDIAIAGAGLLICAPVLAVLAVLIKRNSPGPVLFRQTRVGKNGQCFEVCKLRTMVIDAETMLFDLRDSNEADGPLFKMRDDPRVTTVGRWLRKLSLDELPQLWNVLRGEMSMVGPRPALPSEVQAWDGELFGRLRVRPGVTGLWQVHGRSDASFERYARLDLYYVDNWSLIADLAIIARTVPAVLLARGAC